MPLAEPPESHPQVQPESNGGSSFASSLLRRKSYSQADDDGHVVERVLTAKSLTALGLGGLIGAGVFVTFGVAAHDKAGPAVMVSFIVAALACIGVALCYCECASRVPVGGSAYAYAYASVGEFGAWLTGWNLSTCFLLAGAGVAQGWSGYFQSFLGALGLAWPQVVGGAPFNVDQATGGFVSTGSLFNLPSALILICITFIVYRGIRVSLAMNNIILAIKSAVLGIVIIVGLLKANPANWAPFAPFGWGGFSLASIFSGGGASATGMLAGAAIVFFAFGGFEVMSVYSDECKAPEKNVPIAVITTVGIVTLIYVGVAAAVTGLVPYAQINVDAPVSDAFKQAGMPWAQFLVALGALVGMTSVLLIIVMSLPRVLMAVGRDGLLSQRVFNTLHPTYKTPSKSVVLVGTTALLLASLLPLRLVMDTIMMATLAGYVAVCCFVLVLRKRDQGVHPAFTAPLGAFTPIAGIAICLILMLSLPPVNWIRLGLWWGIGASVYFAYGARQVAKSKAMVPSEPL